MSEAGGYPKTEYSQPPGKVLQFVEFCHLQQTPLVDLAADSCNGKM